MKCIICRPTLGGILFKQISGVDSELLTEPFTEEEIKKKVWNCDGDKSPAPDGFNLKFIKLHVVTWSKRKWWIFSMSFMVRIS